MTRGVQAELVDALAALVMVAIDEAKRLRMVVQFEPDDERQLMQRTQAEHLDALATRGLNALARARATSTEQALATLPGPSAEAWPADRAAAAPPSTPRRLPSAERR